MTRDNDIDIDTFIPYMRDVARCERSLNELNVLWRLIESSAKMNCADEARSMLPMIAATREGFQRLERDLVRSMVAESVTEVLSEIATSAHLVIDTLVRNLYERTADVGFLATDLTLCNCVAGVDEGIDVHARLRAYRSKYTVYDEILLVSPDGTVLAQIDETSPVEGSHDPLLAETMASDTYVETFRATDLRPHKKQALIYSQRMLHPHTGAPCGILCLSFDFEGEMQGLFASSAAAQQHCIALLLNADNQVVASSDSSWIPTGVTVPTNPQGDPKLFIYSGRTYLVHTVETTGYQGYPGPAGWKGQVMIPIEQAFSTKTMQCVDTLKPEVAQGLLSHAQSFCPPLYDIIQAADTIRRVVWNGQVMTAGQRGGSAKLKVVLEQIGETGARTNEVFTQSIRDLYDTVLSAGMRDSQSLTQLLVDLLDRNLYERANDCRWWALSPSLRKLMTQVASRGRADAALLEESTKVLEHINSLYTVYTRLMVYDRNGRILCASNPLMANGTSVLDQRIDPEALHEVLSLHDRQAYHVSPWTGDQAGAEGATYVYHAPIRHEAENSIVGGIAIVFNAIPELQAMLEGCLAGKPKKNALFVNRKGLVLASTDPRTPTGTTVTLPYPHLLTLEPGQSDAVITSYLGHYCILGSSVSRGYREFKTTDGYRDDVVALAFESFGAEVVDNESSLQAAHTIHETPDSAHGIEMATFHVGRQLFALNAETVLEALPAASISRVSAGRLPHCIGTLARHIQGQVQGYVWVFDLGEMLTGQRSRITEHSQVVVIEHCGRKLGVLVSALHGVHYFAPNSIIPAPTLSGSQHMLVHELIKANQGSLLIQCINPDALLNLVQRHSTTPSNIPIGSEVEMAGK